MSKEVTFAPALVPAVGVEVRLGRATILLLFLLINTILSYHFTQLRFGLNLIYENAAPELLVQGLAATPFQYRALMPWLYQLLIDVTVVPPETFLALLKLVEFLSIFLLVVAFRYYLSFFFPHPLQNGTLALSLFYVLPFNYLLSYWYPWDIPSVLFFTAGLIFIYRRQWWGYYPLFIIATFNRETSYFLIAAYLLTNYGRHLAHHQLAHVTAQLVIWVLIKLSLYWLYLESPARLFSFKLTANLLALAEPLSLLTFLTNWGVLWLPILLFYRLIDDPFLRRLLLVVPLFLGVMLMVGVVTELRIYGELIPIIVPATLIIFRRLFTFQSNTT
jgi:hypothetical protein